MGIATSSFSGIALLAKSSVESLGGVRVPIFSLISREWALATLLWEWVLPFWAELRLLCFPCASWSLVLQEVGAAISSFSSTALPIRIYADSLGGAKAPMFSLTFPRQSTATAGSSSGADLAPLPQGLLLAGTGNLYNSPQVVTPPAPRSLYPKGRSAFQLLLDSDYG